MYTEPTAQSSPLQAFLKVCAMFCLTGFAVWGAQEFGLAKTTQAVIAVATFTAVICTTLFFWTHRVAVAFLGVALLISTRAMTLEDMLHCAELDIILFLIGMMIIVGALKDLGFLTWIIQAIINRERMTGIAFTVILCLLSAVLSAAIGEVSSIVVVLALVFQVCDTLKIRSTPFVLIAVFCTNIGSAATMLGNPVGIFIGNKAGFTFGQFLMGATPIALVALAASMVVLLLWYRKSIAEMTRRMEEHRKAHRGLGPLFRIPHRRGAFALTVTLLAIAFHHQIEQVLGLTNSENANVFLIITPLIIAGVLMINHPQRARYYVEHDVEWWTLLFFMLLFSVAGGLQEQGVTTNLADRLASCTTGNLNALVPIVLVITSIGSAFVDNIVCVAAFNPVFHSLVAHSSDYSILWWALLFGACFGGNITVVGSTANIVALGLLERRGHSYIPFLEWLKVGLVISLLTALIAWGMLSVMKLPQPLNARPTANKVENRAPSVP
jgi:Na+/H+ antiporter NhaD/arsenite permease-like protein